MSLTYVAKIVCGVDLTYDSEDEVFYIPNFRGMPVEVADWDTIDEYVAELGLALIELSNPDAYMIGVVCTEVCQRSILSHKVFHVDVPKQLTEFANSSKLPVLTKLVLETF